MPTLKKLTYESSFFLRFSRIFSFFLVWCTINRTVKHCKNCSFGRLMGQDLQCVRKMCKICKVRKKCEKALKFVKEEKKRKKQRKVNKKYICPKTFIKRYEEKRNITNINKSYILPLICALC